MYVLDALSGVQGIEPLGHFPDPLVRLFFTDPRVPLEAVSGVVTVTGGGVPVRRPPIGSLGAGVTLVRAHPR